MEEEIIKLLNEIKALQEEAPDNPIYVDALENLELAHLLLKGFEKSKPNYHFSFPGEAWKSKSLPFGRLKLFLEHLEALDIIQNLIFALGGNGFFDIIKKTEFLGEIDELVTAVKDKLPKDESESKKTNIDLENYAIFISHANANKDLANLLKRFFKDFGINSFVAHDDIEEGMIWEPRLIDAVKNSKIMIVLGTKDIESSAWVNFETGLSYDQMFPIMLDKLTDKVSYIKNTQGIIINYTNIDGSLIRLIKVSMSKLGLELNKTDEEITGLESFKELKEFILNNFPSGKGKDLAITNKVKPSKKNKESNLHDFQKVHEYAYSGNGLDLNRQEAKDFALVFLELFSVPDLEEFKEMYGYAYSGNGLDLNRQEAKDFAIKMLRKNRGI